MTITNAVAALAGLFQDGRLAMLYLPVQKAPIDLSVVPMAEQCELSIQTLPFAIEDPEPWQPCRHHPQKLLRGLPCALGRNRFAAATSRPPRCTQKTAHAGSPMVALYVSIILES